MIADPPPGALREAAAPTGSGRPLAELTTLGVGGPAAQFHAADTTDGLVGAVAAADESGEPVLLLGGGSNVVIGDAGWPHRVIAVRTRGWERADACGGSEITVSAGEPWDDFVQWCVAHRLAGLEALSGIPGLVGATPIQNVGAYGQEVSRSIVRVRAWDRRQGRERQIQAEECEFAYRHSRFKREPGRFVVLSVTFGLEQSDQGKPIRYQELAKALRAGIGDRADLATTRAAVLELRAGKGMVLDPSDPDTRSVGSFFTNPVIPTAQARRLPPEAPSFPVGDRVKVSAAWLIENSGFTRGHGTGPARLSGKHALAITNPGDATAADILDLAREVRAGVQDRFGIALVPEPVLVNCSL